MWRFQRLEKSGIRPWDLVGVLIFTHSLTNPCRSDDWIRFTRGWPWGRNILQQEERVDPDHCAWGKVPNKLLPCTLCTTWMHATCSHQTHLGRSVLVMFIFWFKREKSWSCVCRSCRISWFFLLAPWPEEARTWRTTSQSMESFSAVLVTLLISRLWNYFWSTSDRKRRRTRCLVAAIRCSPFTRRIIPANGFTDFLFIHGFFIRNKKARFVHSRSHLAITGEFFTHSLLIGNC